MGTDRLKKAITITVILFLIGAVVSIFTSINPEAFESFFTTSHGGGMYSTDIEGLDSLNFTIKIIGYFFMATALIYSAIIFNKWLME